MSLKYGNVKSSLRKGYEHFLLVPLIGLECAFSLPQGVFAAQQGAFAVQKADVAAQSAFHTAHSRKYYFLVERIKENFVYLLSYCPPGEKHDVVSSRIVLSKGYYS